MYIFIYTKNKRKMNRTYNTVKTKNVCYNIEHTILEDLRVYAKNKISMSLLIEHAITDFMCNNKIEDVQIKRKYGNSNMLKNNYSIDIKVLEALHIFTHQSFETKISMSALVEYAIIYYLEKQKQII